MILEEIVSAKRREVEQAKREVSVEQMRERLESVQYQTRSFGQALRKSGKTPALIAEIKKASPSRGVIRQDFHPLEIARVYEEEGAAALSVLTDEAYFSGSLGILKEVRRATSLPVLRKDFILDAYQVYESVLAGADAILLIVRLLDDVILQKLLKAAQQYRMDVLVEVHSDEELRRAVDAGAQILGVNNRDLDTLKVDLGTAERLVPRAPKTCTVVAESGIRTHADFQALQSLDGLQAVLIGEAFMEAPDIRAKVRDIVHGSR